MQKTQREIDGMRRQFELESNHRKYRMQLLALQQPAESLESTQKLAILSAVTISMPRAGPGRVQRDGRR